MKVAIRFIYNYAAAPSCHIIDMDGDTWHQFLDGDQKAISCHLLNMDVEADKIQTVSWFLMDGLEDILLTASPKSAVRIFDKSTLRMFLQPFLDMNTSLSCNQVSRIVNIVREYHGFDKKKQPTVNDLTALSADEVMEKKRIGKGTLQIIQETLACYGLAFRNN